MTAPAAEAGPPPERAAGYRDALAAYLTEHGAADYLRSTAPAELAEGAMRRAKERWADVPPDGPARLDWLKGLARDEVLVRALFRDYYPRLFRMLAQHIGAREQTQYLPEDILQEAFQRAAKRWDSFPASGMALYTWLYRACRDCLLNAYDAAACQSRDLRRQVGYPDHSTRQVAAGLFGLSTPSRAAASAEEAERVHLVLDRLDPADRQVLLMRFLDDLQSPEIAAVLDLTPAAVRQRLVRARAAFQRAWEAS
jgi:RNA polymerase sigma-70 factor (ECF subfamily)